MKIQISLANGANAPAYSTGGAAGADLCALLPAPLTLCPGERAMVPTGVFIAVPPGFAAFVYARSGLAVKHGISLSNGVGVIDSDYRGEICAGLINLSANAYTINPGDRIAQLVIQPVDRADFELCHKLPDTLRGEGGFGSTGRS